MKQNEFVENCIQSAKEFGLIDKAEGRKKQNAVIRKNLGHGEDNVQYFAFINPVEATSGPYSDFSLVFFPTMYENLGAERNGTSKYFMSIGVGSEGFRNDYELATLPGMRRLFLKLLPGDEVHYSFCKPKFVDIETPVDFSEVEEGADMRLDKYRSVLSTGCLINPDNYEDMILVKAWIAQYATIRKWPSTKGQRESAKKAINAGRKYAGGQNNEQHNEEKEVSELLNKRRFVVIQGAPGTGKTYLAEKIAKTYYKKVFFTQFHAETTYSDFVYGIFPKLNSEKVEYESKYGVLCEAVEYAKEHSGEKTLLIIDEINRANLANVLGPVFYLFEHKRTNVNNSIKIGEKYFSDIPQNLNVIATMNTADRSIAVVDYALRRRFAWYTLKPKCFSSNDEGRELFEEVSAIFEKYASDAELNLQPGGSYFMANSEEELKSRIEYELMPLIKEYLEEGLLNSAAGEFGDMFYRKIKKNLFE